MWCNPSSEATGAWEVVETVAVAIARPRSVRGLAVPVTRGVATTEFPTAEAGADGDATAVGAVKAGVSKKVICVMVKFPAKIPGEKGQSEQRQVSRWIDLNFRELSDTSGHAERDSVGKTISPLECGSERGENHSPSHVTPPDSHFFA